MVDTYGCRLDEVRAFVDRGWAGAGNNDGDLSAHGELFNLSWEHFESHHLAELGQADAVIVINTPPTAPILAKILASSAKVGLLSIRAAGAVCAPPPSGIPPSVVRASVELSVPEFFSESTY